MENDFLNGRAGLADGELVSLFRIGKKESFRLPGMAFSRHVYCCIVNWIGVCSAAFAVKSMCTVLRISTVSEGG